MSFLVTVSVLLLGVAAAIRFYRHWKSIPSQPLHRPAPKGKISKDEINMFIFDLHHCDDVVGQLRSET